MQAISAHARTRSSHTHSEEGLATPRWMRYDRGTLCAPTCKRITDAPACGGVFAACGVRAIDRSHIVRVSNSEKARFSRRSTVSTPQLARTTSSGASPSGRKYCCSPNDGSTTWINHDPIASRAPNPPSCRFGPAQPILAMHRQRTWCGPPRHYLQRFQGQGSALAVE
jgi:hypothetical protein